MSGLDEIRFWQIVVAESARTIVCSPDLESRVKSFLAARGLDGIHTVQVSRHCPDNTLYILDENALQAAIKKAIR